MTAHAKEADSFQVVRALAPIIPRRPTDLVKRPDIHYVNDFPDEAQRARIWKSATR